MAFVCCLEFRGCPYLGGKKVNATISKGHVVCPLYKGCPLLRVSIIGASTVYMNNIHVMLCKVGEVQQRNLRVVVNFPMHV